MPCYNIYNLIGKTFFLQNTQNLKYRSFKPPLLTIFLTEGDIYDHIYLYRLEITLKAQSHKFYNLYLLNKYKLYTYSGGGGHSGNTEKRLTFNKNIYENYKY